MKSAAIALTLIVAGATALTACGRTDAQTEAPASTPAAVAPMSEAEAAAFEAQDMRNMQQQELAAQRSRAAADPVVGVTERAELCLHFGGEEAYDEERRVQIDQAFENNRCDTVVADGDALKAQRPQDAARIEAAIADLRP